MTCQLQAGVVPKCGQKLTALGTFMGGAAAATFESGTGLFGTFPLLGDSLHGQGLEKETRMVLSGSCRGKLEAPTKHFFLPLWMALRDLVGFHHHLGVRGRVCYCLTIKE